MLIERVARALDRHKIDYAIVGGLAVALHGAVRGTIDIDLILKFNLNDFRNIQKALEEINLLTNT